MEKTANIYSKNKNALFAWTMGITHHAFGVDNVQSMVNLHSCVEWLVGNTQDYFHYEGIAMNRVLVLLVSLRK